MGIVTVCLMISTQRRSLLQSIATTIADYRQGEIAPISPDHIAVWLNQFDPGDQPTILREMGVLLKRFYFSKARIKGTSANFSKSLSLLENLHTKSFPIYISCAHKGLAAARRKCYAL